MALFLTLWIFIHMMILKHGHWQFWKNEINKIGENSRFVRKGLRNIFTPTGIFGCFGGIILYSYYSEMPLDRFKNNNGWKIIGRFVLSFLMMLPFLLFALIPSSAPFAIVLIFSELLQGFSITFVLYFMGRIVMVKLKILESADKNWDKDNQYELEEQENSLNQG